MRLKKFKQNQKGSILIFALVFGSVAFTIIVSGIAGYAIFENKASNRLADRDLAVHIAEAGVNYYRWHLAHNPNDFTDGTGQPGPYPHEYKDKDGNLLGYFSLEIEPPLAGSTVVAISSTGRTLQYPEAGRTLKVRVGFPALTDYTFLSNANMAFSFTTQVSGAVHSNGGIRFDGATNSWVRSAKDRYQYCEGPGGTNCSWKNGVWGGGGPKSFWEFPVPAIDFYSVTADLANLRDAADQGGIHLTSSGKEGWQLVFNNSQFTLYKVTSRDCYYGEGYWWPNSKKKWLWIGNIYCYDIKNRTLVGTYQIPANGAIFIEDDVWLEGVVDGRVSIGVGRFPVQQPYKKLYVNNNLTYAEKGGDDVIGLMSQGAIVVPYEVPDIMEINGALLSQFSKIYRPYYYDNLKDTLTVFGSQISFESGGWKYVTGYGHVVSGFVNTNHVYDGNLKYYPPPSFPVGQVYELISWEEI